MKSINLAYPVFFMGYNQCMKKNIVVIGGGNGSAIIIQALKQHIDLFDLSAIVSMTDSGGSSGILRKEFDTLPPGDILRAVLALSKYDYSLLRKIFNINRFSSLEKLDNHNLGNLFLVLLEKYCGDFVSAIRALEQSLEVVGHAYPVTLQKADLCVELDNGNIVKTEAEIDRPTYDRKLKIVKAWLEPNVQIYDEAYKKIQEADYIVLAFGSLYTSLVATLLPQGVSQAIEQSHAKLVYTQSNAYQADGETGSEKFSQNVDVLEHYLSRPFDTILYNDKKFDATQLGYYKEKNWVPYTMDVHNLDEKKIVGADLVDDAKGSMDHVKIGNVFKTILV